MPGLLSADERQGLDFSLERYQGRAPASRRALRREVLACGAVQRHDSLNFNKLEGGS